MSAPARSVEERFWPKVDRRAASECWPWLGARNTAGYGKLSAGGKYGRTLMAHRVVFELCIGPIPPGHDVDHLCEVKWCVNPAHLVTATRRGHFQRHARRKTHCPRGHEYTEYRGGRVCRTCGAERKRRAAQR